MNSITRWKIVAVLDNLNFDINAYNNTFPCPFKKLYQYPIRNSNVNCKY